MKKISSSFLLLIMMLVNLSAQFDFRPGYIIKYNNDTVHGLIDFKGSIRSAEICRFKAENKAPIKEFRPEDISGYRFDNGKFYVVRDIPADSGKIQKVFLEYLMEGIINVYFLRDHAGDHYFLEKKPGKLIELNKKNMEIYRNGTKYIVEDKRYQGIIKAMLNDCPQIQNQINHFDLNQSSMINLAKTYHGFMCKDQECIIFEKKEHGINITFGLFASIQTKSLYLISTDFDPKEYYLQGSHFNHPVTISPGIDIQVNMPGVNEKLFVALESSVSQFTLKTKNTNFIETANLTYASDITLKEFVLHNALLFSYRFTGKKTTPFIELGTFIDNLLKNDFECKTSREYTWESSYSSYAEYTESPFTNTDYGISLGTGMVKNYSGKHSLVCGIRYSYGFGLHTNFNSGLLSLRIGYQF